jgi:hypothetical protein
MLSTSGTGRGSTNLMRVACPHCGHGTTQPDGRQLTIYEFDARRLKYAQPSRARTVSRSLNDHALGVAAAPWQGREGKIVLFESDGGLWFHIQELETIKRQGSRIPDLRDERRRIRLGVPKAA